MTTKSTKNHMLKKAMITALEKSLGVVTTAAKSVGIERTAHYTWMEKDPKYRAAVEELQEVAIDFAESKLFKAIENGSEASTIFFLKTKGKKRGYVERQEFDHTTKGDKIIPPISWVDGNSE